MENMHLQIRKDGMYVEIQDELGIHEEEIATFELPLSYYLPYSISIDPNLLMRDILNVLLPYRDQIIMLYLGYIKKFDIDEIFKPVQQGDDAISTQLTSIGFIWETNITRRPDERLPEIDVVPSCIGVKSEKTADYIEINYIDFALTDLYHILDKPVFVDTYVEFGEVAPGGKYISSMTGDRIWTLHDLILALFYISLPLEEGEIIEEQDDEDVIDRPIKEQEISDTITATHLIEILDDMEKPSV